MTVNLPPHDAATDDMAHTMNGSPINGGPVADTNGRHSGPEGDEATPVPAPQDKLIVGVDFGISRWWSIVAEGIC